MNFKDKKIFFSGGNSGFGLELVKILLDAGATVFAVSRRADELKLGNANLKTYNADLMTQKGVDESFQAALDAMGDIDIYFANSGFGYHEKLTTDWKKIENIYALNVFSPSYALAKMVEYRQDQPFLFVLTASAISYMGMPGMAHYTGTKAAVHRFMEAARYELNENQRISAIYPTAMKTSFFTQASTNEPVPAMQQDTYKAARNTVKSLKKGRKSIFPYRLLAVAFLPSIIQDKLTHIVKQKEAKRFNAWIDKTSK